jgi:hypothetical protein
MPLIPIPTPRVSIPERTVDAWVATYLCAEFPHLELWAPTTRGWDDWDYAGDPGLGAGKLFVLECKSTVPVGVQHVARLGWRQFHRYLALPQTRSITYYVFPSPPWTGSPGAPPPLVPSEARMWRGCEKWMYVIAARDLRRHYGGVTHDVEVVSVDLPTISGSRTLEQFVAALRTCRVGRRFDGRGGTQEPPEPRSRPGDELDLDSLRADAGLPVMTPTVGFVPAADLPAFD